MKTVQNTRRSLSLAAGALALGLVFGVEAAPVSTEVPLENVTGPIQTGTFSTGTGNVTALFDFTIPAGGITSDTVALGGSSNPIDFSTTFNGVIDTGIPGVFQLTSTLDAAKTFESGAALSSFLLDGVQNDFDSASLTIEEFGATTPVLNPTASITNQTFDGAAILANLTGGTLNLSGDQDDLAGLNLENGQLNDGSAVVNASGDVDDMDGGDGAGDNGQNGGAADVPAPSGLGLMLMGLGLVGFTVLKRRGSTAG